ncbi:hypothetical protein HGRIS_004128 [Hohenbuehelia grisea]
MSAVANTTATFSSTTPLPPVAHSISLPVIIFLIILVFIVGAIAVSFLTLCRGSASEVVGDLEKNSMNEKASRRRSIRGQSILKLTGNLLDIFPFDFYTLIPTRRAPFFDRLTGIVAFPSTSAFIPLQPRFITKAALESSESYTGNLFLDFPLPPSAPSAPATPESACFPLTRLEMDAAISPIPILLFTPPTPKKVKTRGNSQTVLVKDTLHPVYGSLYKTQLFTPSVVRLPTKPINTTFF